MSDHSNPSHPNRVHPSLARFSPTRLETSCPRYFYLSEVLELKPSTPQPALTFGSAIHMFIENWQLNRNTDLSPELCYSQAIDSVTATENQPEDLFSPLIDNNSGDEYSYDNFLTICEEYSKLYWNDGLKLWKTEAVHWQPMPNGTTLGGIIDGVYLTPSNAIIIRDTKTTRGYLTSAWFFPGMENKFQLSVYYYFCQQLYPNHEIIGIEIDAISIKKPDFHRRLLSRTDLQISEMLNTYANKTDNIMKGLALPADEQPAHFHCETTQCTAYGGCRFKEICTYGFNPVTILPFKDNPNLKSFANK